MTALRTPVYYGWFVLAASAVTEMLVMGATSYATGLFVLPLEGEFHLSRADASSSVLILYLGASLMAPLAGKVLDRYSIRMVVTTAALLFGAALGAITLAKTLWVMVALLVLPAAGAYAVLGPMTTATLASRWFYRRRGLALGIAAVSTSGGGFIVVPLLSLAIQHYGWRLALLYEALLICGIIIALALTVLRDNPFAMGLGEEPENRGRLERPQESRSAASTLRVRDILGRHGFWVPSLTLATISGTCQAMVTTLVPYGVGLGFDQTKAAFLISAFAVAAAITKVGAGLLGDRLNQRLLLVAAALFMTLSWMTFSIFTGYGALFFGSCLAGVALGCALPTVGALMAAEFGSARLGTAMGWAYALIFSFAIASTRFIGFIYDHTGSYDAGFEIFSIILFCLLAATSLFAMKGRKA